MEQNLKYYEIRAKAMSVSQLHYALLDVMKTIELLESDEATRNNPTPYLRKLYAEKDAYTTEKYGRKL